MKSVDSDIDFVKGLIQRYHFTEEETHKLINMLQRYLLLRDRRKREIA
jgi:hypothetical protein